MIFLLRGLCMLVVNAKPRTAQITQTAATWKHPIHIPLHDLHTMRRLSIMEEGIDLA